MSRLILTSFSLFWFISIFLSIIQVGGLFEVSGYTYFILYVNIFFFSLGFFSIKLTNSQCTFLTKDYVENRIEHIIHNKLFIFLVIFVCIYVYSLLIVFFEALASSMSMSDIRTDFFSGELYGPLFAQIDAFVLSPLVILSTPVFSFLIFYRRNFVCLLLFFFLFGYESLSGGRFGYVRIILAVVFMLIIVLRSYKIEPVRFKRFFMLFFISLSLLLAVITVSRTSEERKVDADIEESINSTLGHLGVYTAGPVVALDHAIKFNYVDRIGGFQYGALTLSGVTSVVNLFTSRLGFVFDLPLEKKLMKIKQLEQISVSNSFTSFNALYTAILYFYCDLHLLGVILFPFIFGCITRYVIKKFYIYQSFCLLALISWLYYVIIFSVVDFWLVNPYHLLVLFVLYFVGTKKYLFNKK